MATVKGSEITTPKRGQAVWMVVNGKPALRYFVEFYSSGCRVAFESNLKEVYYDELAYFFKSEESTLLTFIEGITQRIIHLTEEMEKYRQRLSEIQKH